MQHIERERLAGLQLSALQQRFSELRDRIPVLNAMAAELGAGDLDEVDDVVPLLFQHSVYKSYPVPLLERNRFEAMTKWLGRLTTVDISDAPVSECDSIDAWLDVLDSRTELRVSHSSGTTGAMSFLPRSLGDWDRMGEAMRCGLFQFSDPLGERDHAGEYFNLIWPLHRYGRVGITRVPELTTAHLLGPEERIHALREGRLSSDSMFLAARVRAAAARGELDQLQINPALRARREEFEREQREVQQSLPRFIEESIEQFRGERILLIGTWNTLYAMAKAGLERGLERVFAPDSVVTTGGGAKGQVVPDDWEELLLRFVGVDRLQHVYSMTEMTALNKLCERGHFHFEPWIVPFVLDPQDGRPLPRVGRQTGRAAFFDLLPESYWGGFITGDEVTADWTPCQCGRTTVHIERKIERYSEKQGGDDKITCAASDDAHRAGVEFLTERLA
ncbi:MAG: long-chain-fatty-acid--protein ligase [Solirubrobacteraceae bacterium]